MQTRFATIRLLKDAEQLSAFAEAGVPTTSSGNGDQPRFPETDVAIVIGASDTVNSGAQEDELAIAGIPVIECDSSRKNLNLWSRRWRRS